MGQKLPIRAAHNTFLEIRQPEVTKNSYTHFLGSSWWTKSENDEKVYEKRLWKKNCYISWSINLSRIKAPIPSVSFIMTAFVEVWSLWNRKFKVQYNISINLGNWFFYELQSFSVLLIKYALKGSSMDFIGSLLLFHLSMLSQKCASRKNHTKKVSKKF